MPLNFLIVEDDRAQQKLLSNVVMMLGATSQFANNGVEALTLVENDAYDIILMDIEMPRMGGVATADRLLHQWAGLSIRPRILAVSGKASPDQVNLCRAIGMDGFVAKPYTVPTLRMALQSLVLHGHAWAEGGNNRLLDLQKLEQSFLNQGDLWYQEGTAIRGHLQTELTAESQSTISQYASEHGFVKLLNASTNLSAPSVLDEELVDFDKAFAAASQWREESQSLEAAAA